MLTSLGLKCKQVCHNNIVETNKKKPCKYNMSIKTHVMETI